jgi:hypothetical protein
MAQTTCAALSCLEVIQPSREDNANDIASVEARLKDALFEFQSKLTPSERARLQGLRNVPEATDVMNFTEGLDAENARRRTRGVSGRLIKFLESIQQFSGIVGPLVSSNPALAALLWGSVQLMLLVCLLDVCQAL